MQGMNECDCGASHQLQMNRWGHNMWQWQSERPTCGCRMQEDQGGVEDQGVVDGIGILGTDRQSLARQFLQQEKPRLLGILGLRSSISIIAVHIGGNRATGTLGQYHMVLDLWSITWSMSSLSSSVGGSSTEGAASGLKSIPQATKLT
jgi:hypothetical protein